MTFFHTLSQWPKRVLLPFFFSVVVLLLAQSVFAVPLSAHLKSSLQKSLRQEQGPLDAGYGGIDPKSWAYLQRVYQAFSGDLLWVDSEGLTDKAWALLRVLHGSSSHGLSPSRYHVAEILELLPSKKIENLVQLELLLTQGLVRYVQDMNVGILPRRGDSKRAIEDHLKERQDALPVVVEAIASEHFVDYLEQLPPDHYYYRRLQHALVRYRNIEASGGWPHIPEGALLRPGDTDPRIKAVKLRLLKTEFLQGQQSSMSDDYYDDALRQAVCQFQRHHGLWPDGVLGAKTIAAMNIPVARYIEILRLNLLRWHGLAHKLGERYVLVNIATCILAAVDDDQVVLTMPVVVGKQSSQTPMFSDWVRYLVFNPYWTITPNIAKTEELAGLRKDPNHLATRHIRLFSSWFDDAVELDSTAIDWYTITPNKMASFRLRQDPGPWNSLGKLKFVSQNRFSVFLHDTPTPSFFHRKQRIGSHGCVWVSKPPAMAGFFLENQRDKYSATDIFMMYQDDVRVVVPLRTPVPLHLAYQTVQIDKRGKVFFTGDIYGLDMTMRHYLYEE